MLFKFQEITSNIFLVSSFGLVLFENEFGVGAGVASLVFRQGSSRNTVFSRVFGLCFLGDVASEKLLNDT